MSINKMISVVAFLAIAALANADDATWITVGTADWNDDANWLLGDGSNAFPDAGFDDTPVINNGGTAFLEEPALGNDEPFSSVVVGGGGLEIRDGGGLTATTLSVEDVGSLSLAGDSSLAVDGDASTVGFTSISGPAVNYSVGGAYTLGGTLEAVISGASHSPVKVEGAATISASLRPVFDGVIPKLGDSWSLIDAGSVVGTFSSVDTAGLPPLDPGVIYTAAVNTNEGNIDLVVTNTLELVVDRRSGAASVRNVVGDPISLDNYVITSPSGRLDPAAWTSFADSGGAGGGWAEGASDAQSLNESRAGGPTTLAVGSPVEIGSPVVPANFAPEDINFSFSSEGLSLPGIVTYENVPFNLILNVDPDTGTAEITNQATVPIEFDGYAVVSASGTLKPADGAWNSLADSGLGGGSWVEANPSANALSELNPTSTTTLAPNESLGLGPLFDISGERDLIFNYFLAGGVPDLRAGFVAYGFEPGEVPICPPANRLPGDADGDGEVAFLDFLALANNFGQDAGYDGGDFDCDGEVAFLDFLILANNFGATASASAASVPEPSSLGLIAFAALMLSIARGRKRRCGFDRAAAR